MSDRGSQTIDWRYHPLHSSNNLLPKASLQQHGSALKLRMGENAWKMRMSVEERINPATGLSLLRLFQIWSHRFSQFTLWLCLGLLGIRKTAHNNCWKPTLTKHRIPIKGFPAGSTLRILHLSDFHLDTRLEQAEQWANMIRNLDIDLAVITGDFFNGYALPAAPEIKALQQIVDAISTPIIGVLGNHDCILSAPHIESLGIKLLLNESTTLKVGNHSILISGIDDPHFFKSDDLKHALQSASDFDKVDLRLLLAHAPKDPESYASAGFQLCLCGHTHGGQLCTRAFTPLLRNGRYARATISGWWQQDKMLGFTSRGTGTGRLAYRINCAPEIALLQISG